MDSIHEWGNVAKPVKQLLEKEGFEWNPTLEEWLVHKAKDNYLVTIYVNGISLTAIVTQRNKLEEFLFEYREIYTGSLDFVNRYNEMVKKLQEFFKEKGID